MTMQSSPVILLLMAFLVVISAGIAGCSDKTPSAGPASVNSPAPVNTTPVPAGTPSIPGLSELVLQPSEIPGNFTLVEQRERAASELSGWAVGHGWMKGYSVTYRKNDSNSPGTIIRQNISVYSGKNATLAVSDTIDGMAGWIANQSDANLSVEKISLASLGDASGSLKYSDRSDNSGMYVIAFAKKGVFQDIETNGTAADYETARQIATIAAAKI